MSRRPLSHTEVQSRVHEALDNAGVDRGELTKLAQYTAGCTNKPYAVVLGFLSRLIVKVGIPPEQDRHSTLYLRDTPQRDIVVMTRRVDDFPTDYLWPVFHTLALHKGDNGLDFDDPLSVDTAHTEDEAQEIHNAVCTMYAN